MIHLVTPILPKGTTINYVGMVKSRPIFYAGDFFFGRNSSEVKMFLKALLWEKKFLIALLRERKIFDGPSPGKKIF